MANTAGRPVDQTIAAIRQRTGSVERFIPTRYPFTYAADFFRSHPADFGHDPHDERLGGRSSGPIREYALRTGQNPVEVTIALADAHLDEWRIRATREQRSAALVVQRVISWKSMGLAGPLIKRGMRFVHASQLDIAWTPGPGQKHADAPKRKMVVTRVSGEVVYYGPDGSARGQWRSSVDSMDEGGSTVGRWLI